MPARRSLLLVMLIAAGLLGWGRPAYTAAAQASPQGATPVDIQPVTDQELVRNGDFGQAGAYNHPVGWMKTGTGSGVAATAGPDGGPAMALQAISETRADLYQELYLPTQTSAARLAFDYRLLPSEYSLGGAAQFYAAIVTATGAIALALVTPAIAYDTGWQHVQVALDAGAVAGIQAAHAADVRVYVQFILMQNAANSMQAHLDNVSLRVSGSMNHPTWSGSIAYVGWDEGGRPRSVGRLDPDGRKRQTLWSHPSAIGPHIYDVAWKPDASELAFSSDHEFAYSAFHTDVYGIRPDGSGLRRITNPPSRATLQAGGYPLGSVTGRVHNNYGSVTVFLLYIEGARDAVAVDIGGYGAEASFAVPDVADLGAGTKYVVFSWSDLNCANGKEYSAAVLHVQPGQTVDVGTLTFNGACGHYEAKSIAWRRDGAQVGTDVITPRVFRAAGEPLGSALFGGTTLAGELAWSPVSDQILYRNLTFSASTSGIYLTSAGAGAGARLVAEGGSILYMTPAWLPDGSGFVYSMDHYLYQYTLADHQSTLLAYFYDEYVLNPSVSPDGRYVVFEWQTGSATVQRNLWLLERAHPTQMWALTKDGRSGNPSWSRVTPAQRQTLHLPLVQRP